MSGWLEEDDVSYLQQRAQVLYVLNDIRDIVTSVPLDTPLTPDQLQELDILGKDLWNEHILLAFRNALANFKVPDDRLDLAPDLAAAKYQLEQEMMQLFNYDRLREMGSVAFKDWVRKCIRDFQTELDKTHDKASMTTQLKQRLVSAMQQAAKDLEQMDKQMITTNPKLKKQSSYVFAYAGGFIGAVCGILLYPVVAIPVAIGMAAITTASVVKGVKETINTGSVVPMITYVGLGVVVGSIGMLVGLGMGLITSVSEGIRLGAHSGKRTENEQYKFRTDILYGISQFESSLNDTNLFRKVAQKASDIFNYYEQIFRTEELHHKFAILDVLNEKDPDLVKDLKQHFRRCLDGLQNAIARANDNEVKVDLRENLKMLEKDWSKIQRALEQSDLTAFKRAATDFLARVEPPAPGWDKRRSLLYHGLIPERGRRTEPEQLYNDAQVLIQRLTTLH